MNADGETCVIDPARFYLGSVACEEAWCCTPNPHRKPQTANPNAQVAQVFHETCPELSFVIESIQVNLLPTPSHVISREADKF